MPDFEASVIEEITNHRLPPKTLANWTNRGLWFLPQDEAERGRARRYSREQIIEAVIASRLISAGLSRETAKAAIKSRCVSFATFAGAGAALEGETIEAFGKLPEFSGVEDDWFWIVAQQRDSEGSALNQGGVIAVQGPVSLGKRLYDLKEIACVTLCVSQVIRDIDAVISRPEADR